MYVVKHTTVFDAFSVGSPATRIGIIFFYIVAKGTHNSRIVYKSMATRVCSLGRHQNQIRSIAQWKQYWTVWRMNGIVIKTRQIRCVQSACTHKHTHIEAHMQYCIYVYVIVVALWRPRLLHTLLMSLLLLLWWMTTAMAEKYRGLCLYVHVSHRIDRRNSMQDGFVWLGSLFEASMCVVRVASMWCAYASPNTRASLSPAMVFYHGHGPFAWLCL